MTKLDQPLTEKRVAKLLMRDRWMKGFCLPNYTPAGWWENDVFYVTEAGYWIEFEIKLTRADFKSDAEKTREVLQRDWEPPRMFENKHDLLATTDRGPCQFFYVAPEGVIPAAMVPPWAGLIEVAGDSYLSERAPTVKAPRRHKNKLDEGIRINASSTCYYRMHRLL